MKVKLFISINLINYLLVIYFIYKDPTKTGTMSNPSFN